MGIGADRTWGLATEASDLRRKQVREACDLLVERAAALPESDRLLLEAVYRDGRSARELALLGPPDPDAVEKRARAIRRRVHSLVARLASREFEYVARHAEAWPTARRRVATACVLHGMALREAARELKVSLHNVRRHRDDVFALARAAG